MDELPIKDNSEIELNSINLNPQNDVVEPINNESKQIDLEVPFTPFNHATTQVSTEDYLKPFGFEHGPPIEKPEFIEGAVANWQHINESWRLLHGGWDRQEDAALGVYKDPNFNPLEFPEKIQDINTQFMPYLLSSENDRQMDFRIKRIRHEQWLNDTVKNSSWTQWIVGGGIALPTDLINYVPIIGQMKYARWGKNAIAAVARALPGAAAFGFGSSLGEEVDKINGNFHDFLEDGIIRSVFATSLFAGAPIISLAADKLALWNLKSYVGDAVKGIGYKIKVGEKGKVEGLEAYEMPGRSVGADAVKLAQDKADSEFYKGGLFKIPYIGEAAEKFMSNSFFGSNTLSMLRSPFEAVRVGIDLAYDHGIITKGLAEGKARPIPFFSLMQQTMAHIRQEQDIFNALHMERNGVDSKNYISQTVQQAGMYLRQKSLKKIESEIGDRPYINQKQFSDEVQQVIRTETPHENAAVNEAANMFRKSMDSYYSAWREAYNLPADWMPPRTAQAYLMRVYDTNFLNNNLTGNGGWLTVISNELRNQDNTIIKYMQPIRDVEKQLEDGIALKERLNLQANVPDRLHKETSDAIEALRANKKALEEKLQNDIRKNPELHLLADDWNALSADEAKQLKAITKKRDIAQKEIDEQKEVISKIKAEASKRKSASIKAKTAKTAKNNVRKSAIGEQIMAKEQQKLAILEKELKEEKSAIQELIHSGKVNRRFYSQPKDSPIYLLRDQGERLKLRKTYHEKVGYIADEETAHGFRMEHAKAYYDTIMNQTAEDTINQIMGKFTGNSRENHTKQRTLNISDEILYQYKFLTSDLQAKVANYKIWLARRTHLKNVYGKVSLDGGFDNLINNLHQQFDNMHVALNEDKSKIEDKLKNEKISETEKLKLQKGLNKVENKIKKVRKEFNKGKEQLSFVYEKMMGISKLSMRSKRILSALKSFNVAANLSFLPLTMITDLTANGLKNGLVPFIQSGLYPTIESLGGILKTHDSASLRNTAGAINLALHHIGNTSASRQMDLSVNPYLNLGRIPSALDKVAHFSSNFNLTTTIDNFLQHLTSAVVQSNVIRHMVAHSEGKLSRADKMWLNRYGLDPEKDGKAILKAFKKDGGGTNKLGGYQSNFYHWQDIESSNKVGDAVFRATHDTIISANSLDSPMWLDENGVLGFMAPIIRGFKGWAFASLNRYLIPTMQEPDAQKLMGFALMTASAALVSPTRRMARGESPYRQNQGAKEIITEILMDSPQFSWLSQGINDMNLFTGGTLLRELKNDKYYDRTIMGILGPTGSNANKLYNFVGAMSSGDMNQHDVMGMASMIPIVNSMYGFDASKHIVENFFPRKYRSR